MIGNDIIAMAKATFVKREIAKKPNYVQQQFVTASTPEIEQDSCGLPFSQNQQ